MPIYKKNISQYPEVLNYFQKYYTNNLNSLKNVPILEISEDLWAKFHLVGYGYVVRSQELLKNKQFLEMAATNNNYYNSLPTPEHKRDVNIYKIYKKINEDLFLIVRHGENSSHFIVHELSHLLPNTKEFEQMDFQDDYLNLPEEQFAHLNEIRYAQEKGLSFNDYFRNSFSDAYNMVKLFEQGDKSVSEEEYKLSKMDEKDYQTMWEYVKNMEKTSKTSKIFIKTAQTLSKEIIHGKYGDFGAYIVSGNTFPIRDKLKNLGFKWYQVKQSWWISDKKYNDYIKNELIKIGIGEPIVQPTSPQASQQPLVQPKQPLQPTEDADMSKWYGFPINHNIMEYDLDFELNGKPHTESVVIDRLYVPGKDSSEYRKVKSREYKGRPKYVVRIGSKTVKDKIEPLGVMNFIAKEQWGTYDETTYLNELKNTIKIRLENNPPQKRVSNANNSIKWYYDLQKRTPEFKQFLRDVDDNKLKQEYTMHIDDPVYGGDYPVSITVYGGEDEDAVYVNTALKDPQAPREDFVDTVNLYGIHTIDEFNNKINQSLSANNEPKERYIKYLKSFPFLPEQKQESFKDFGEISRVIENPEASVDYVLNKIKEKGYIRPHKRQKQEAGLSSGEEIKWIVDSKKIVNDAYNFGTSPDYFYAVVAYYIHRKIRGIWSWTDMMLTDTMSQWVNVMKRYGATFSFEEMEKVIETIGKLIIEKIYGKKIKEDQYKSFNNWFTGEDNGKEEVADGSVVSTFINFAKQYGIDPEGIKDNVKKVYRMLANKLHPDKYVDLVEKEKMTEKFKELQQIWDNMPPTYKTAFSWYDRVIFSSLKIHK